MTSTIRTATTNDIEALCNLLALLFSLEEEFIVDRDQQRRGLLLILNNPSIGEILVLEKDNIIIGMVNLLYTISTALGAKVVLLEDMVMDTSARGKGLGSELMQAAIAWSRKKECKRITLLTDGMNSSAITFYEKQGFQISEMLPMRFLL
ncbi:MAG: GCN5-related N-acetyltransferase [Chitinophagaceae bacterium]|nr:GCN5-related N-acetyltransferase [Chitinophagaceae bacterium]